MSIYATALAFGNDDHEPDCPGRIPGRRTRKGKQVNPTCRCGAGAPIVYQGSHVLPAEDDARDGSLLLCQIPGFVSRGDRVLCGDDDRCLKPGAVCCDRVWPYLRLSVHGPGDATVVLDHAQVQRIHAYLGEWLEHADPKAP